MKSVLEYRVKVPNEDSETLEIVCDASGSTDGKIMLRGQGCVLMTDAEFEQVVTIVNTFRTMKGLRYATSPKPE